MRLWLFYLTFTFCNITLGDFTGDEVLKIETSCKGKSLAELLETLLQVESLHNCSLNVVKVEKDEVYRYLVEVQDDYICERDPLNCHFELQTFEIESFCLQNTNNKVEDFFYQDHYQFPGAVVSQFVKANYDYFGNLIYFSMGERSLIPEKNHRVTCKPSLFGG